jgi:hypothetical protein
MRSIISLHGLFNQFCEKAIPEADRAPPVLIKGASCRHARRRAVRPRIDGFVGIPGADAGRARALWHDGLLGQRAHSGVNSGSVSVVALRCFAAISLA